MSNDKNELVPVSSRTVVKTVTKGESTTIHYSDGSKQIHYHTKHLAGVKGTTSTGSSKGSSSSSSSSKGSKSSSSSSSYKGSSSSSSSSYKGGSSYSSGYSGGTYYGGSGWNNKPTKAFVANGIEFWGTPKSKLDDVLFQEGDLVINCTGHSWTPKAPPKPKLFAKTLPDWMELPEVLMTPTKPHNNGELASQVLLDWTDMRPPPAEADLEFWGAILDQAANKGIKRIYCCCMAGQGRTGTALSALLLATGAVDEPDIAIDYIRENYNEKAVETKGQEEYIFGLIYEPYDEPEEPPSSSNNRKL